MSITTSCVDVLANDPWGTRSLLTAPVQCDIVLLQPFFAECKREPRVAMDWTISRVGIHLTKRHYQLMRAIIRQNFNAIAFYHPSQYSVHAWHVEPPGQWEPSHHVNQCRGCRTAFSLALRKVRGSESE